MIELELVLRGGTVVHPNGEVAQQEVGVASGRIAVLASPGTDLPARLQHDVTGMYLFPGVVDPHTHLGVGGGMEEYLTDTGAASIGGVTAVINILIDSGDYDPLIREHVSAADAAARTDFGLHLTLMHPGHAGAIRSYAQGHGITSFKYYMSFRGDEGAYLGADGTDDGVLITVLEAVRDVDGVLAIHPENIEIIWALRERLRESGRDDLRAWHESRPPYTEAEAVLRAAYLAGQVGCRVYMVHLSGAQPVDAVRAARRTVPHGQVFAETCPHFLTHNHESPIGTLGKVNPPLRAASDNEALWQALADETLDVVGSDHVGRRRRDKTVSVWDASAGFPGTSTILPVLLSEGYHQGRLELSRIARLTSYNPARIFGLGHRKGAIAPGMDADIAVVDLEWRRRADAAALGTWCDYGLYEDRELQGWPRETYLRGNLIQQDGELVASPGIGEYLPR